MVAFGASFLKYLVIFIILVAVAVLGVVLGVALRKRKDAKEWNENKNNQKKDEV